MVKKFINHHIKSITEKSELAKISFHHSLKCVNPTLATYTVNLIFEAKLMDFIRKPGVSMYTPTVDINGMF